MNKFHKTILCICVSVLALAVCVIFSEFLVRAFKPQRPVRYYEIPDPKFYKIMRPNTEYSDPYCSSGIPYTVKTNKIGLRMNDEINPDPDIGKVLFTGDSFTFGWGVEIEESFYGLLKEVIEPAGSYQVVNGGLSNQSTGHIIRRLQKFETEFEFSHVVYFLNPNDPNDNFNLDPNFRVMEYRFRKDGSVRLKDADVFIPRKRFLFSQKWYMWLNYHSHLFTLTKKGVRIFLEGRKPSAAAPGSGSAKRDHKKVRVTMAYIRLLHDRVSKSGAKLIIVAIPKKHSLTMQGISDSDVYRQIKKRIRNLSSEKGFVFIDPLADMKKIMEISNIEADEMYFTDGHYNITGNRVFSDAVGEKLKKALTGADAE